MRKTFYRIVCILAIVMLAVGLRGYAANNLLIDGDEPVYINAAVAYAGYIRSGQWREIPWYEKNVEHPLLNKLVYGVALLTQPQLNAMWAKDFPKYSPIADAEGRPWGMVGRWTSATFGVLAVLALALLNPFAGLFLAVHTIAVRYTGSMLLEALPFLTGLLAAVFYLRWFTKPPDGSRRWIWLILSGAALGATAAAKYTFAVVGLAIGLHWLVFAFREKQLIRTAPWMVLWGLVAGGCFFAFDPYLWPDPVYRLYHSLTFHANYSQRDFVRSFNYPFWQPLVWLTSTYPAKHPDYADAFIIGIDPLIFALGLIGLPRTWRRRPLFVLWLLIGLATLFVWPTKWPQYTMIVLAPLCLAAGEGVGWVWERARGIWTRVHAESADKKHPSSISSSDD